MNKKIILTIAQMTFALLCFGQKNVADLLTQSNVIRTQNTPGGNTRDLIANMYDQVIKSNANIVGGSYANPAWITSLSWGKITSTPTTLSGYGISSGLNTINGQSLFGNSNLVITGTWGGVTGTLSDQTDLQSALDAKIGSASNGLTITSGVVKLGGTALSSFTTIPLGNQTLNFSNSGGSSAFVIYGGVSQNVQTDIYAGATSGFRVWGYYSSSLMQLVESSYTGTPSYGTYSLRIGSSADNKGTIVKMIGDYSTPANSGYHLQFYNGGTILDRMTLDSDGNLAFVLGSDTDGDFYTRQSGRLTRIPIGAANKFLVSSGTAIGWSSQILSIGNTGGLTTSGAGAVFFSTSGVTGPISLPATGGTMATTTQSETFTNKTITNLLMTAGTTTVPTFRMGIGALLSSATANAWEYDGTHLYFTPNATGTRVDLLAGGGLSNAASSLEITSTASSGSNLIGTGLIADATNASITMGLSGATGGQFRQFIAAGTQSNIEISFISKGSQGVHTYGNHFAIVDSYSSQASAIVFQADAGSGYNIGASNIAKGSNADFNLSGASGISGLINGGNANLIGGQAFGTGNGNGGDALIVGGLKNGSGANGKTYAKVNGVLTNLTHADLVTDATTSRTITEADRNRVITFTNSGAIAVTLPNGLGNGFPVTIVRGSGAGIITISASTTLNTLNSLNTLEADFAQATFLHMGSNVWNGFGAFGPQ